MSDFHYKPRKKQSVIFKLCIHALAYSFVGAQTLYLATHWDPIYWDTACLVVNSGSLEEAVDENGENIYDDNEADEKEKKVNNTDYGKVAKALGEINP